MFTTLRCRVFTDSSGAYSEIPALLTASGWFMPLVDYCLDRSHDRSTNWMMKLLHSLTLFLEYVLANPQEKDSYRLFQNFANRLSTGTFNRETGLDPSWLCWHPISPTEANKTICHLTDFFDWMNKKRGANMEFNPRYAGGAFDRLADEAAYQFRRDRALLGHSWKPNQDLENSDQSPNAHIFRPYRTAKVEKSDPPAFPDERLMDLLGKGFIVGGKTNYRDMLITLLLHGAGFRTSEPFHLYVTDVLHDPANPKEARVHIHHPSEGFAPMDPGWIDERSNPKKGKRSAYLSEQFGLSPRNHLLGAKAAGWKNPILDNSSYMRAYWFIPRYGELFLTLWYRYMEQVARFDRPHPFAWINLSQGQKGGMYCLSQYRKDHAAACERIGLVVGKELGTTPHGHRHAYGRRLVAGGFGPEMIRKFMHHHSLDSQRVYTTPTPQQIFEALNDGAERLLQIHRRDR